MVSIKGSLGCVIIVELCCLTVFKKKIEYQREVQMCAGSVGSQIQILCKTIPCLVSNRTQSGEELFTITTCVQ